MTREYHEGYQQGYKDAKEEGKELTTKNNLGIEEVTALAEWTEKLTKASEDVYNRGYADGANEVLDKLRAEIEAEPYVSKMEVLDIIDKYKAESEVEDENKYESI